MAFDQPWEPVFCVQHTVLASIITELWYHVPTVAIVSDTANIRQHGFYVAVSIDWGFFVGVFVIRALLDFSSRVYIRASLLKTNSWIGIKRVALEEIMYQNLPTTLNFILRSTK